MAPAALITVLAYGHILSAVCWLGGGILTGLVIGPSLQTLTVPARLEFNAKILPKLIRFVQAAVGSTFVFGLLLLYTYYNGNFAFLHTTTQGYELSAGILLAVVVAIIGFTVTLPAFKGISKISNGLLQGGQQAPPPELARYGKRAMLASLLSLVLLLVVLATMVSVGFPF